MLKKLKVLMLAAELTPVAKAGGLGDVIGALPKELVRAGEDVRIILPLYGLIDRDKYKLKLKIAKLPVKLGLKVEHINIYTSVIPGSRVKVYYIEHEFYNGDSIYVGSRMPIGETTYTRNFTDVERFAFFGLASLEVVKRLKWQPDVIHCHDWHTGLVPDMLKTVYKHDKFFSNTKTLYTIHNLANQGVANPALLEFLGINLAEFKNVQNNPEATINCMAQGIMTADAVNTVSIQYSKEILGKEYGCGLERYLKVRQKNLYGVVNGIDVDFFNPRTDKFIAKKFDIEHLEYKKINKVSLQKTLKLPTNPDLPVFGLVSRFVNQKGLDLVTEDLAKFDAQFVFLGTGQKDIEAGLQLLEAKYRNKFRIIYKFDEKLAQNIYAASDFFLMPSRFEPCGLGQMIAMRYGSVPVVRATGGLVDTVNNTNGFSFAGYKPSNLNRVVKEALTVFYTQPKKYLGLQKRGLKTDFSWQKSAKTYVKIYKNLAKVK